MAGKPSTIDPDQDDHESYLSKFKNKITDKIRILIEEHISNDPDVIKGRKKTVQVKCSASNYNVRKTDQTSKLLVYIKKKSSSLSGTY